MNWQWLADLLGADRYQAHAICLSRDPLVMTFFTVANMGTAISYLLMGALLLIYARRIRRVNEQARWLYGCFIFFCGLHHLCEVLTLYAGIYFLEMVVDAAMCGVSIGTAVYTARSISKSFDEAYEG